MALIVAKRYKTAEVELIEILQLVGENRVFYHFKYNSLFQYAVQALGLSEEVAYIYINVSRKASELPRLQEEIRAGRISVSKAKAISSVLNIENQDHWLELAQSKSKRQIEREVALASAKHAVRERANYTSALSGEQVKLLRLNEVYVELKLGVPEKLMLKLRQAQDVVSQSKQHHATLVETLNAMVDLYLEKRDPVAKAKRQKIRGKLAAQVDEEVNKLENKQENKQFNEQVPGPVDVDAASSARKPFSAVLRSQIYLKHQGQCSYLNELGIRCSQRRLLEIHHIVPVSQGGTNNLANVTLLCQGHHRVQHTIELEPSSYF